MKNSYYEITKKKRKKKKKKKKEYVCVVAEKRKWRLEIGFVGEQTNKDTLHFRESHKPESFGLYFSPIFLKDFINSYQNSKLVNLSSYFP